MEVDAGHITLGAAALANLITLLGVGFTNRNEIKNATKHYDEGVKGLRNDIREVFRRMDGEGFNLCKWHHAEIIALQKKVFRKEKGNGEAAT